MSYELTSVPLSYAEAVNSIKLIKMSNQRLAKDGDPDNERRIVAEAKRRIEGWINDVERSYVEPQAAYKLQMMREQLRQQYHKHQTYLATIQENIRKQQSSTRDEEAQQEGMNDLEFDFEHEEHLTKQKTKQLKDAHSKLCNINGIVDETQRMTFEQGKNLDLIDDNLTGSLVNVQESNSYLQEANEQHKKSQKKYGCLLIFAGATLLTVVLIFLILL